MSTIVAEARAAAIRQIEADFHRVFTRWKRKAPWRDAAKGGEGSGFHGHAGRAGKRGGSQKRGNTQMSRVQAEAFAEGSKATGAYYHATSAQTAAAIRSEGFRLDVRHSSNFYGEGVYLTNRKGVKFFGDTDVEVRVNVKNPYIHLPDPDEPTQPFLTRLSTSPFANEITEKMAADNTLSKAKALTLVLQGKGYDSVITREDEDVLVVFDPADIAIVEADTPSTKGGEGSGFHAHAGRPGQRGGSAPLAQGIYAQYGQRASASETLLVSDDDLQRDHHRLTVMGETIIIGGGYRYSPRSGGDYVDVTRKILVGPSTWLLRDARDIPEVMDAVEDAFSQLADDTGGDFSSVEYTGDKHLIASLLHGYKSPLTYKAHLDTLNAMTRAYLAGNAVSVRHDTTRAAILQSDIDDMAKRLAEVDDANVKRLLQDISKRYPDELLSAKLHALRLANMVRSVVGQEAVNQFASEVQRTQADLKERYGDTVTLYRGVQGDYASAIKKATRKAGSEVEIAIYPASSWSEDESIAREFSGKKGVVIKRDVPVNRIMFSYHTSPYVRINDWVFGGTEEYEMIVSSDSDTIRIRKEDLV